MLFREGHREIDVHVRRRPDDLPVLELDRDGVKRAVINILDNAVAACMARADYARPTSAPSIELRTRWHDAGARTWCALEIADNGVGMTAGGAGARLRAVLLDQDATARASASRSCRRSSPITTASSACATTSRAAARFIIEFPVRRQAAQHRRARARLRGVRTSVKRSGRRHGRTILVVDDEAQIRHTLRGVLADEGYDVVEARGRAARARRSSSSRLPRLAIVDIWMPEMDGIELVQRMRDAGAGGADHRHLGPRHDRDRRARDPRWAPSTSSRSRSSSTRCCASSTARSASARRRRSRPIAAVDAGAPAPSASPPRRLPQRTIARSVVVNGQGLHSGVRTGPHPAAAAARQRHRLREHHDAARRCRRSSTTSTRPATRRRSSAAAWSRRPSST